jgi:hypothetical protein
VVVLCVSIFGGGLYDRVFLGKTLVGVGCRNTIAGRQQHNVILTR